MRVKSSRASSKRCATSPLSVPDPREHAAFQSQEAQQQANRGCAVGLRQATRNHPSQQSEIVAQRLQFSPMHLSAGGVYGVEVLFEFEDQIIGANLCSQFHPEASLRRRLPVGDVEKDGR